VVNSTTMKSATHRGGVILPPTAAGEEPFWTKGGALLFVGRHFVGASFGVRLCRRMCGGGYAPPSALNFFIGAKPLQLGVAQITYKLGTEGRSHFRTSGGKAVMLVAFNALEVAGTTFCAKLGRQW